MEAIFRAFSPAILEWQRGKDKIQNKMHDTLVLSKSRKIVDWKKKGFQINQFVETP